MRLLDASLRLCCVVVFLSSYALGQSTDSNRPALSRRNPDGWFSLRIPTFMGEVERFADVDGGLYSSGELAIKYDYWTYENTPHFLRDAETGEPPGLPLLACSTQAKQNRALRAVIDGKKAFIQRCSKTDAGRARWYIYYVTFPRLKVYDGQGFKEGTLNLTITYRSHRYLRLANAIAYSFCLASNNADNDVKEIAASLPDEVVWIRRRRDSFRSKPPGRYARYLERKALLPKLKERPAVLSPSQQVPQF